MKVMFEGQYAAVSPRRTADSCAAVWLQIRVWHLWHLPRFLAAVAPVIEQARRHPGVLRFGFEISWLKLRFRTFGAFDTEASMRDFVAAGAHGVIYRQLGGRLGEMSARYGPIAVAELPSHWDDIPASSFARSTRPTTLSR